MKEQERLDEDMRKRREKVERWRKEKEEQEKQALAAAGAEQASQDVEAVASNAADHKWSLDDDEEEKDKDQNQDGDQEKEKDTEMKPAQIDEEKKEAKTDAPAPTTDAMMAKETAPQASEQVEDDEEDPLDAFMNQMLSKEQKKQQQQQEQQQKATSSISTNGASNSSAAANSGAGGSGIKAVRLEDGEEAAQAMEEESDDESDKLKEVKKGKRELLSTDHAKMDYPDFEKNFYIEVPSLANMTDTEVIDARYEMGIKIAGKNCPKPIQTWSQCGLPEKIHQLLKTHKYEKPTSIQAQTIPAIMSGRDVIGIARTGSGKTLAFLLPMFRHVLAQEKPKAGEGMVGLIMSPTRELALQIYSECKKFSKVLGLRVSCVYGGANIGEQISDLKRGADIVVCTPGRMIDILCANNKRITNLRRVSFVVLDEADRMFDLGFGPQITCVIDNVRPDRQTVMFSATFPFKVEQVARKILTKPLEIICGGRSIVCADVEQIVEVRPNETRYRRLLELLAIWYHKGSILIFTNKQDTTDTLFGQLSRAGYECLSLHGSKDQTDRDETISDFKNKIKKILIATPLASRGLDVKDLNLVVNFDCPDHLEDYVHRVGRTGRAGNKGTAYTFILQEESRFAPSIIKALEQSGAKVPEELVKLGQEYAKLRQEGKEIKVSSGYGGRGHKFDAAEEERKKEKRKLEKKQYDIDDDEDDDEVKEVKEDTKTPPVTATPTADVTPAPETPLNGTPATPADGLSAGEQAIKQIQQVVATPLQISTEAAIRAAQQAVAVATGVVKAPVKPPRVSQHLATFHDEVEINDYSQQARWKVTHKDAMQQIIEMTGTAITAKGLYFPPNKPVPAGQKKLSLLVEGPTDSGVRTAVAEIKRILDEAQLLSHSDKGKYSIF
ncbi:hypothetical protein SAMD00019534_091830 [Acytostelium subglobosum LB1]|uniref:hypothetical protein n=1 Tax=Acytostelium subglobosum LB1 TaxID=1410327 RepID=UPI000644BB5E|nr:hypothetical protein SAMD00019534_091830 [Acytostelium subglobosum LB1]GAM26008.1 hypothetical protein SAMD00019534_091830 [Acytostelium subglobosum LB1]|eukprot:XP_012751051.1 hypothetical protein SAMD00019534_091830 [Acytostelium subglobosum LB1]